MIVQWVAGPLPQYLNLKTEQIMLKLREKKPAFHLRIDSLRNDRHE